MAPNPDEPTPRMGMFSIVGGVLLAVLLLPFASRFPNFVVPDDGYFYTRIAQNLAAGRGSTFDGIHVTSGYHLPWAFVLAAVSKIVGLYSNDPTVHLAGHLALACASIAFTTLRFFRGYTFRATAFVVFLMTFGMTEMAIAVPILLAILSLVLENAPRWRQLLFLAFALPLVRIDLVCVPIAIAAFLAVRDRTSRSTSRLLIAGAVVGALVQLAIMRLAFGEFLSVAAWLKVHQRAAVLAHVLGNVSGGSFAAFSYVAHIGMAAVVLLPRTRDPRGVAVVFGCLSFVAMHGGLSLVRPWYWAPTWLGLLLAVERSRLTMQRAPQLLAVGIALTFIVHAIRSEVVYAEDRRIAERFLSELKTRLPPRAKLFTYGPPGYIGLFSGLDVVDGDGLVNDFAYARRYVAGTLDGYLDEERLCYLVVADMDADPVLEVSGLVVGRDEVTSLFAIRRREPNQVDYALYQLNAPRCRP